MSRSIPVMRGSEVEGMVGDLPWCRPLDQWPTKCLMRALGLDEDALDVLDDSPALAAAIRRELESR